MNRAFNLIIIILSITLIIGCGNKRNPTGGPIDTEKPVLSATLPEPFGDISSRRIELTFSKALDKSSLTRGIYIYPPILDKKVNYASNVVTIEIREDLKPDTNYYVTLTTAIKDTRGNSLNQNQTQIFRHGKFKDHRISGVFHLEDVADAPLPVSINVLSPDSLMIMSRQFSGRAYAIDALNPSAHILRAYIDKNDNGRYDYGAEPYFEGRTPLQQFVNLDINLAYADTTKPVINSVQAISDRELRITLSKPLHQWKEIKVLTPSERRFLPIAITLVEGKLLTLLTEPADSTRYLLEIHAARDAKGNVQSITTLQFNGSTRADTTAPVILATFPRSGTAISDLRPVIEIRFSKIIPANAIQYSLIRSDTKQAVPLEIIQADHKIYRFRPSQDLINQKSYLLTIKAATTDFNGNPLGRDFEMTFLPLIRR